MPKDCVILTLACGKYRLQQADFGEIDGIPRLLDIGQCNDAYSAIQIAVALAKAFDVGVNDLPLSLILSWYEQKAVAILLTLLHLGIKNIRLGPSLPAFVTPTVLEVLVEKFSIAPITTPEADLQAILGSSAFDMRKGTDREKAQVIFPPEGRTMRQAIPKEVELQKGGRLYASPSTKKYEFYFPLAFGFSSFARSFRLFSLSSPLAVQFL